MTDVRSQGVLLAEQVEALYSQSDKYIQSLPRRNVQGDPLDLPDDSECHEQVVKALGEKLHSILVSALDQNRERFSLGFEAAMTTGDRDGALDQAIKFLFTQPTNEEQARRMTQYLHTYLGQEDTLIDITQKLQDYGHMR